MPSLETTRSCSAMPEASRTRSRRRNRIASTYRHYSRHTNTLIDLPRALPFLPLPSGVAPEARCTVAPSRLSPLSPLPQPALTPPAVLSPSRCSEKRGGQRAIAVFVWFMVRFSLCALAHKNASIKNVGFGAVRSSTRWASVSKPVVPFRKNAAADSTSRFQLFSRAAHARCVLCFAIGR